MLVSWENKAGLDSAEGAKDKGVFKGLLSDFWEGLGLLLVSYGDDKDADPKVLEGVATMLQVVIILGIPIGLDPSVDYFSNFKEKC